MAEGKKSKDQIIDELKTVNEQIEFVLGATKIGLDIIDAGFNMMYIDSEWAKVYGDYKGKKCYKYFAGRDSICHGCGIPEALKTKKPVVKEEVLPREGNRPIEVISVPFQNEKGEWLVAEANIDITKRKEIERDLKRSTEEWQRTFDVINDLVFIQDTNFTITKVNKAFAAALKAKPEDIVGKKCYELLHKSKEPWPDCPFVRTVKNKAANVQEVDDPKIGIPLLVSTSPIFNAKGELVGSVHIARDITDMKKAEKELKKKMKDLETFQKAAVGRELKMVEMRKRIKELEGKLK